MCDSRRCVLSILLKGVVLVEAIFLVTCDELTTTDDYLAPGSHLVGCSGKPADVVFVLDTSNSIWSRDFRNQMEFVRDVITLFPIDSGLIRVGLVTYADFPTLHFRLGQYDRKSDVQSAIARIRHVGGYGTRTAEALRFLRDVGFQFQVSENRINVTRVGIVVTDGLSDNPDQTRREAERTRERGIHLFAVGVGSDRDLKELEAIASPPKQDYTILADSYRGLNSIRKLLAIRTCAVTNPTTTTSTTTTTATTDEPRKTVPLLRRFLTSNLETLVPLFHGSPPIAPRPTTQPLAMPDKSERIGNEWSRTNSNKETSNRDGAAEEHGKLSNDLEKSKVLGKRPVFWKLETNGSSSRIWQEDFSFRDDKVLPSLTNGSSVTFKGDKIWSTEQDGGRSLVGEVINGSKFIGHWIDADRRVWYGYAVMETAGRGNVDVGNSRLGKEEGTAFPDEGEGPNEGGTDGFWATDEAGRTVWYRYVHPGVYESVRDFETSSERLGKTLTFDVEDATTGSGSGSMSPEIQDVTKQLQKGCRPYKPTDVAFVLDHDPRHAELEQDIWILVRAIISELDAEEEDLLSFQFVRRCSESVCLDQGRYSSKANALRDVDSTLQEIQKNSSHLIDKMRDSLAGTESDRRHKVGVYMTNSRSDNFDETILASDRAKNLDEIEMFAVGFRGAANPTELQAVASCPIEQHYYLLDRRLNDQIATAVAKKISRLICSERNKE